MTDTELAERVTKLSKQFRNGLITEREFIAKTIETVWIDFLGFDQAPKVVDHAD